MIELADTVYAINIALTWLAFGAAIAGVVALGLHFAIDLEEEDHV